MENDFETLKEQALQVIEQNDAAGAINAMGYALDDFATALARAAQAISRMWSTVQKVASAITLLNENYFRFVESYEKRELYKLSFARPTIRHQVIDRKPRHLVKKIIR